MEDDKRAKLEDAQRHLRNLESAHDQIVDRHGEVLTKYAPEAYQAFLQGRQATGIPAEAEDAVAEVLNAKGYIEHARAEIDDIEGFPETAQSHRESGDRFWNARDYFNQHRR